MSTFLSFLLFMFLVSACSCTKYTKSKKSPACNFKPQNLDEKKEKLVYTSGTRYSYTRKNSDEEHQICCPFDGTSVYFDDKTKNTSCCVFPPPKKWPLSNVRICASTTHLVKFPGTGKNFEPVNNPAAPYNQNKCTKQHTLDTASFKVASSEGTTEIVGLTDLQENCVDPRRKFQVKVYALREKLVLGHLYSWCCSRDIFGNYSLDPKTECCGLSGALSPNFAHGKKGNGAILRDTPPCCRSQGGQPLCEPAVLGNGDYVSKTCPPLSGLATVTKNLKEDIPYFAPAYYAIKKGASQLSRFYSNSFCAIPTYKHFFTFRDILDSSKNEFEEQYGLCCTKENMFAESVDTMAKECCIAFTDQLKGNKAPIKLPCDPTKGGIRTEGSAKVLFYKPCNEKACSENGKTSLSASDEYKVKYEVKQLIPHKPNNIPYLVSPLSLYGSDYYFVNRNNVFTQILTPTFAPQP